MVSKFPYLGEYRSMKKTHKSFFFMSMIDNIIPVSIALPKDGQPDGGLTKDYDNSSLKKLGSEDFLTMYPPSPILHLSNIPATLGESDLREVFRNKEIPVEGFKFFEEDEKMALVEFRNVDDTIMAIVKLDNYQFLETSHLRVSFSKSTI